MTYKVEINPESTAEEGVHYEPLLDEYIFTAGKSTVELPVYVKYSPDLDEGTVTLSFRLVESDQMDVGYPNQLNARLLITNQLIKPVYWDSILSIYFSSYSKVKHEICTEIMGHDFPLTLEEAKYYDNETIYGYWMHAGREAAAYFATHDVYDENDNLISTWIPF